ncbi:hypothetical protein SEA_MAGUCO_8 [Arthrobacter phage MaGuCo]|uniref:Uncharacterized protein n=1 Tax=Arthrobacter phage MaGuCo TaxID=3038363 RepID=A0AAF0GFR4_9CAUD|nr:hypothetical protein SEA_MAGUCO_8 [Arthrobacter phage MaGuCo]
MHTTEPMILDDTVYVAADDGGPTIPLLAKEDLSAPES